MKLIREVVSKTSTAKLMGHLMDLPEIDERLDKMELRKMLKSCMVTLRIDIDVLLTDASGGDGGGDGGDGDGEDDGGGDGDDEDPASAPQPRGWGAKEKLLKVTTYSTTILSSVAEVAILFVLTYFSIQLSHSWHLLNVTNSVAICALYGLFLRAIYRLVRLVSDNNIGEDERPCKPRLATSTFFLLTPSRHAVYDQSKY